MNAVLVVDDNPGVRTALSILFEIESIPCVCAANPREAMQAVRQGSIGVVIQDMNFSRDATSGHEGEQLFHRIRAHDPNMPVLLMTAWTSLETAVRLVKEGAQDYLAKPWDDERLLTTVRNLLSMRERRDEPIPNQEGLVYVSRIMAEVVRLAHNVAQSDVPVLITGPNGVGKELIADLIHRHSSRREAPMVKVNAGAIPQDLIEAELFGAEAGAYTGAHKKRVGHFEMAHGGTLFLDEIGDLPVPGQVKLLRVLQNGDFQRLGSSQTRKVDVRIVSATNTNLRAAVRDRLFRQDLFFRLNVIEIHVPGLADRPDDIEVLARYYLKRFATQFQKEVTFSPAALKAMHDHTWTGNVRELINMIQRAVLTTENNLIEPSHFGLYATDPEHSDEKRRLEEVIKEHHGVIARAAQALGISRQALYRQMEKHGVKLEKTIRDGR